MFLNEESWLYLKINTEKKIILEIKKEKDKKCYNWDWT